MDATAGCSATDAATGAAAVGVFGGAACLSALLFGWFADRYGRVKSLGLSYFVRGTGTLLLALAIPNELLESEPYLFGPGVYDPMGAQLAMYHGFKAVYFSGYSFAIGHLGTTDMDLYSGPEIADGARRTKVDADQQGLGNVHMHRSHEPAWSVRADGNEGQVERAEALGAFYGGPVWARHRDTANATMRNVMMLLRKGMFCVCSVWRPGPRPPTY